MRVALIWLLCAFAWAANPGGIHADLGVRIPMRDGVRLSANIFRPAGTGRFPVILVRTPYGKGSALTAHYRAFVEHGYVVVIQDVRGRYESEGRFEPLEQEPPDSDDTLNWIARQPWSSGRIGMIGGSYLGIVQWKAALTGNRHLKAIFPVVSGCDEYLDRFYSAGGAMKLGQRLWWIAANLRAPGYAAAEFSRYISHLPLRTADRAATGRTIDFFQDALNHPAYDSFWKAISTREQLAKVTVPVFSVGGWYDNFVESDLEAFTRRRAGNHPHRIMIGPWAHNMSAEFAGVNFGPEAKVPLRKYQLEWFDYWLKSPGKRDAAPVPGPPARIFVMGANRWRDENEWPPARARATRFYLSSRGRANTLEGDGVLKSRVPGAEPADRFVYDPRDPVPTAGGPVCCNPKVIPWGPMDQRAIEKRPDVLVYTSQPLRRDLEVTGPVRVVLYVSTSAPDTDFTAKLVDVFPDGHARNLTDGILRLRYRQSLEKALPASPGEAYAITINAGVTSNVFLRGHRIRLEISSSNFPRFDRNPNTGGSIADARTGRPAVQTVYHDRTRPSHLLLPVIPN